MRRALVVGNDYPGSEAELAGCVNDARAWAGYLRSRGFSVMLHLNASAEAILAGLQLHVAKSDRLDALAVFYSGHGTNLRDDDGDEGDGRDEALVGADLVPVRDDALFAALSALRPGVNCTVVLDCCFSGSASRVFGGTVPRRGRARYIRPVEVGAPEEGPQTQGALAQSRSKNGTPRPVVGPGDLRWVQLSACKDTEVALESPNPDGTVSGDFTRAALAVLARAGAQMTRGGLLRAVLAELGAEREQTPTLDGPVALARRTLVTRLRG